MSDQKRGERYYNFGQVNEAIRPGEIMEEVIDPKAVAMSMVRPLLMAERQRLEQAVVDAAFRSRRVFKAYEAKMIGQNVVHESQSALNDAVDALAAFLEAQWEEKRWTENNS